LLLVFKNFKIDQFILTYLDIKNENYFNLSRNNKIIIDGIINQNLQIFNALNINKQILEELNGIVPSDDKTIGKFYGQYFR